MRSVESHSVSLAKTIEHAFVIKHLQSQFFNISNPALFTSMFALLQSWHIARLLCVLPPQTTEHETGGRKVHDTKKTWIYITP